MFKSVIGLCAVCIDLCNFPQADIEARAQARSTKCRHARTYMYVCIHVCRNKCTQCTSVHTRTRRQLIRHRYTLSSVFEHRFSYISDLLSFTNNPPPPHEQLQYVIKILPNLPFGRVPKNPNSFPTNPERSHNIM